MEEIPTATNNRHSAAFTSSGVTSPVSPTGDDFDHKPKGRKPVGGVAVLPMMDMKRMEEQRKTPTEQKQRPFSSSSIKSPTSETSEVCHFFSHNNFFLLQLILFFLFLTFFLYFKFILLHGFYFLRVFFVKFPKHPPIILRT